jgi:hypothetical protein
MRSADPRYVINVLILIVCHAQTQDVDTDAQTPMVDGDEDDIIISAVPITTASSSPPPILAPLPVTLLTEPEPIMVSPTLVIDEEISAEPSATLALATYEVSTTLSTFY